MSIDVQTSVVRITSADSDNRVFGTGFVISHDLDGVHTYVVTCAHVVRDVGGAMQIKASNLEAELVAPGEPDGLDIAVLRVKGLQERPPLRLRTSGKQGNPVEIIGNPKYGGYRRIEALIGVLGKQVTYEDTQCTNRVPGWNLTLDDESKLLEGYSGSPVLCRNSDHVVGVVITKENEQQGSVISIAALTYIWPEMPPDLLLPDSNTDKPDNTNDDRHTSITLPAQTTTTANSASVYLATYVPRAAEGAYPGEHVIDLKPFFYQGDPEPVIWEQQIIPRLEKQLVALRTTRQNTFHLRAFARNSAGLAFGFVFRQKAGFHIKYTDNYNETWDTSSTSEELSPLIYSAISTSTGNFAPDNGTGLDLPPPKLRQVLTETFNETELNDLCFDMSVDYESLPGSSKADKARELVQYCQRRGRYDELAETCRKLRPKAFLSGGEHVSQVAPTAQQNQLDAKDLIIELAITQPAPRVQEPVDRWIRQHQPAIRKRILLELRRDQLRITPPEGAAIAQQVCGIIQREGTFSGTTHLFGAMLLGVALLIGWNLQSVGRIQCYELDRDGHYQPTCLIRAF